MNLNPIMIVVALIDKMEIQTKRHLILEVQRFSCCVLKYAPSLTQWNYIKGKVTIFCMIVYTFIQYLLSADFVYLFISLLNLLKMTLIKVKLKSFDTICIDF